jgi:hypothetical protein
MNPSKSLSLQTPPLLEALAALQQRQTALDSGPGRMKRGRGLNHWQTIGL